jgi:predicted nucleic acid-binding protein
LKILLDASALLPLITQSGKKLITEASHTDFWTTDLAIYESCNAIWKLVTLLKTLTSKEAQNIIEVLKELTDKNLIKTTNFTNINLPNTLDIAQKLQLTFYDASYITASQNLKATFVTDDQKLLKAANKYTQTITFSGLQSELAKTQTN